MLQFLKNKDHFNLVLTQHFLFVFGYVPIKFALAIYLINIGFSDTDSYAIITSSFALSALCAIAWSLSSKYLPSHRESTFVGTLFVLISSIFLSVGQKPTILLGLPFLIIGDSLYFLNMNLFINNYFKDKFDRQTGNHKYLLTLNLGALLGFLTLMFVSGGEQYKVLYMAGAGSILLSALCILYPKMNLLSKTNSKQIAALLLCSLLLLIVTYELLLYSTISRCIAIITFALVVAYICYYGIKNRSSGYLEFLLMTVFCGCIYWIAQTVIYSQFMLFISANFQHTIFGISYSPAFILAFDPIANLFFGYFILKLYKKYRFEENNSLIISLMLLGISFTVIPCVVFMENPLLKYNIGWAILAIMLYGFAEFLLLSTLSSRVSTLTQNLNAQKFFFATQKLANAFAAATAYYLIMFSSPSAAITDKNVLVYLIIFILSMFSAALMFFVNRRGLNLKKYQTIQEIS